MNKVILDPAVRANLNGLNEHLQICDEAGKTVGYFLPPALHQELVSAWARSLFTDEELAQARAEIKAEGGMTTTEVLAHLEEVAEAAKGGS